MINGFQNFSQLSCWNNNKNICGRSFFVIFFSETHQGCHAILFGRCLIVDKKTHSSIGTVHENGRFQTGAPKIGFFGATEDLLKKNWGRYKMKVMPSMPATMSLSLRKRRFEVLFLGRCLVGCCCCCCWSISHLNGKGKLIFPTAISWIGYVSSAGRLFP